MMTAGCDVGWLTSKAVVLKDGAVAAARVTRSGARPWETGKRVLEEALAAAGASMKDIDYCVATGYGRERLDFAREAVSEIACHARGASWLVPTARTVIDIGGQDCKAIKIDGQGRVERFLTNDKCASGTGRFLEVMAGVLGASLDELGAMSLRARQTVTLASACTVWAQADVIQQLNAGVPREDIAAGVNHAMAARMAVLVNNIGAERDICMTGGVAKNDGVAAALEKLLGVRVRRVRRADPQIAGALGAALIAAEKAKGGRA